MPELMGEQHPELVVVQQLDSGRVDHDKRGVDTIGTGVEEGRLRNVQLGDLSPIEGRGDLGMQMPELGKLRWADPDGVALEEETNAPFSAQHAEHLPDDLVDTRNAPKRLEGGAIGRVLPRDGGDLGKALTGTNGGNVAGHLIGSTLEARGRTRAAGGGFTM